MGCGSRSGARRELNDMLMVRRGREGRKRKSVSELKNVCVFRGLS